MFWRKPYEGNNKYHGIQKQKYQKRYRIPIEYCVANLRPLRLVGHNGPPYGKSRDPLLLEVAGTTHTYSQHKVEVIDKKGQE